MNEKAAFLPFHAINEFMRPDFRLTVIRDVLNNLPALPHEHSTEIANLTKRYVKIPGFRNSEKAPPLIKTMPMVKAFEKNPGFVSGVLSAWAEIHRELLLQVYEILKSRGWELSEGLSFSALKDDFTNKWPILPPEADRRLAPGFVPRWFKGEDFETLYGSYQKQYPDSSASVDQISLIAVWLTLRLPYTVEDTIIQGEPVDR